MHGDIAQFDLFAGLNHSQLTLLVKHARRLSVPAGRWLLRPGRSLRGHHFLLQGTVMTTQPDGLVSAGRPAARQAIYPGVAGLRTLTDCELLQVSDSVLELLALLDPASSENLILVGEVGDCWESRFLSSELMTQMPPAIWQSILRRLDSSFYYRGDRIIEEGDVDLSCCFILASGKARVLKRGNEIASVEPGGLFGEDALISREPRNATVEMMTDGVIGGLDARDFKQFLADLLLQGAYQAPPVTAVVLRGDSKGRGRELIRFASSRDLRERIARLRSNVEYLVSSSHTEVEALAIFLMRKRGLRAWAAPRS